MKPHHIKLRTTKYYPVPSGCTIFWTDEDWEKTAVIRTEPRKIKSMGYVWRAWERDAKGTLFYMRAEKCNDD